MPFFKPLVPPGPLPEPESAIELAAQDFKAQDTASKYERAKDMAAFANHVGGSIIIGAKEVDGRLRAYVGLAPKTAAESRRRFDEAATECTPKPTIDTVEFPCPGDAALRVVVVNVAPSLTLLGVRVRGDRAEGYGGHAYVFPVRCGTSTHYLDPGQLAMYMTPAIRRTALLLHRIPIGSVVRVVHERPGNDYSIANQTFKGLSEDDNYVELERDGQTSRIPLDIVVAVFLGPHPNDSVIRWQIYYRWR